MSVKLFFFKKAFSLCFMQNFVFSFQLPLEKVIYYVQHALIVLIPFFLLRQGRLFTAERIGDFSWIALSIAIQSIYHFVLLQVIGLVSINWFTFSRKVAIFVPNILQTSMQLSVRHDIWVKVVVLLCLRPISPMAKGTIIIHDWVSVSLYLILNYKRDEKELRSGMCVTMRFRNGFEGEENFENLFVGDKESCL